MTCYLDTSFLCALYVPQESSARAVACYRRMKEPLAVTSLLLFEFRQAVRLQMHRHALDRRQGFARRVGEQALQKLSDNMKEEGIVAQPVDWADVHALAERLSSQFTLTGGHRSMDVLHVATALHLEVQEFLTFDENQKQLASAAGLTVPV